jgi:hypothetical protein
MKKWLVAIGACAALSIAPMGVFAHGGYDAGDAALGGLIGGVVGGLIGSGAAPVYVAPAPAPMVVERYAPPPVVVERYQPAPVFVERYAPPPVVVERRGYYRDGHRHWHDRDWRRHELRERKWRERERRHWDD